MEPYRRKVNSMVKQLEAMKESCGPEKLEEFDEEQLSVRIEYVDKVCNSFDEAQTHIDQNGDDEIDSSDRMDFNNLYFDIKSTLARFKKKFGQNSGRLPSSTQRQFSMEDPIASSGRRTRLPEIQLPKFSGSYADWPNFFALFSTVIDKNDELSDLEKFHHLRSNLRDTALDTVASLELTDTNYREAISLLKNRFDNTLLHFQAHIKNIFALKVVGNGSATSLRHLSDQLNAHLRALLNIGTKEQIADGLLIYLVTTKMDVPTKVKWEESLKVNQLPNWNSLTQFLERRCRLLENLANSDIERPLNTQHPKKLSLANKFVHVSTTSPQSTCSLCDSRSHFIASCTQFVNLSPVQRLEEVKRLKLCINCLRKGHMMKKCSSGSCRKCSSKHNTLLHFEPTPPSLSANTANIQSLENGAVLVASAPENRSKFAATSVLLATVIILVKNRCGLYVPCRAILDSASQINLITCQLTNRPRLKCNSTYSTISGIGDGSIVISKSADIEVKSCNGSFETSFTAMVVPSITSYQPSINLSVPEWKIPDNIRLADPSFDKCSRIDILIGAELFFELMSVGQIKLAHNLPLLQKTLFGWVVAGKGLHSQHSWSLTISQKHQHQEEENLSSIIKNFWEVENNFICNEHINNEDEYCEQHFTAHTIRLSSGAYSVRLPPKECLGIASLGDSYQRALQRFHSLERKFKKYPEIKAQYSDFMSEYLSLNHMSTLSQQVASKQYFLPHHCVLKLDSTSTKLRVVFDGSAKTSSGLSLNDVLCSGPTIQRKLFNTLLQFRCFKVALSGDICKMYRCVHVREPDDHLQCILWRNSPDEDIKPYKLNTVTYGTKPAAFLAIRAMHQLAADEEANFPLGAKILRRDFYVDDLLTGGNSVEEVKKIRQQIADLLSKGGFIIRKWCSNDSDVLQGVPADQCEKFLKFHDGSDVTKTLGLVWDPKGDHFIFSFSQPRQNITPTKRSILSSIARLYDPLGLVGPVITKAKVLMQQLWKLNLQWDESLPQQLETAWLNYSSNLSLIPRLIFPRYVSTPSSTLQLHAFCDASLTAYGACVYLRSEVGQTVKTMLLCSKSRVSPLKTLTVPKLELSAALLLAELVDVVIKTLPFHCSVHCWSDSMVVLSWIREQPSNFQIFVSNQHSNLNNSDVLALRANKRKPSRYFVQRCNA